MARRRAPINERVMKLPDAPGCWLWTGPLDRAGYGKCDKNGRKSSGKAHREIWKLVRGPIPPGLGVLHRCDVPCCINPEHLFLGDQKLNMLDCAKKGRTSNRKLTVSDVLAIRADQGSDAAVASMFGVDPSTIGGIRRRTSWEHV